MTYLEILNAVGMQEELVDFEFKSAKGGVPGSMWETYSGMANSEGGTIVLGVEEQDGKYFISGVPDPIKTRKTIWDTVHNRGKISSNLLKESDVSVVQVGNHQVVVVQVPKAHRRQRPVYVGQNPLEGTYRRNNDGDYKCQPDEVGRMLADQSEEPADSQILLGFAIGDLDAASIQQYRNRFSARDPQHPWLALENQGLLEKLGAWRHDRRSGEEGLTVAGLLMFGNDEAIRDPQALPNYHVDYQEKVSDDPAIRWDNRLAPDGKWVANVFQFYQAVLLRLTQDLKIPFQLGSDLFRRDETPVHEAIREALVNSIIHADYHGKGGIVIRKRRQGIELSNPGSLLVSFDQLVRGGISECRNKSLQLMFQMIGGAEKAGSGVDKIVKGWRSQNWLIPSVLPQYDPDRVTWRLPFLSMLPEDATDSLKKQFGEQYDTLTPQECMAMVVAETEEQVSNSRLQLMSDMHPADLSRMLRGLVQKGFLVPEGTKRTVCYRLPPKERSEDASLFDLDSPLKEPSSPHKTADSPHKRGDSPSKQDRSESTEELGAAELESLYEIAAPSRNSRRLAPEPMQELILKVCRGRWLTVKQLADILSRDGDTLRDRLLRPLVVHRKLEQLHPTKRNTPHQAYRTTENGAGNHQEVR